MSLLIAGGMDDRFGSTVLFCTGLEYFRDVNTGQEPSVELTGVAVALVLII